MSRPPSPMAKAVAALRTAGWVYDGVTGGDAPGRERWHLPGSDRWVTVGPQTTCFYRKAPLVSGSENVDFEKLSTREAEMVDRRARELARAHDVAGEADLFGQGDIS